MSVEGGAPPSVSRSGATAGTAGLRPPLPAYQPAAAGPAFLTLLVEVALWGQLFRGELAPLYTALGHAAVVLALALLLWRQLRRKQDTGAYLLLIPAVLIAGPFGALGGVLIGLLSRRRQDDVARLEDWYRRLALSTELDPTARLADRVLTGRTLDFARDAPPSITDLIVTGTVAQQQAILGVIARRFHPDYLAGLQKALVAEEPVVRVQAAAVAARIRGELPAYIDTVLRDASDLALPPDRIIELLEDARRCAASGLLEAKERERAERLMDGIMARTLLRLERGGTRRLPLSGPAIDAYEAHLLASNRNAAFRRLRRTRTWAARGPWVWRPTRRSPNRRSPARAT